MSRKIEDLTPRLRVVYARFKEEMEKAGLRFIVTQTLRTKEEQEALYAQSRQPLHIVNALRQAAGLGAIDAATNKKAVTWTKNSRHLPQGDGKAIAFDICIVDAKGTPQWNDIKSFKKAGEIGQKVGLLWGGSWRTPDLPHFELKE